MPECTITQRKVFTQLVYDVCNKEASVEATGSIAWRGQFLADDV